LENFFEAKRKKKNEKFFSYREVKVVKFLN